jgi:hypothetical protein
MYFCWSPSILLVSIHPSIQTAALLGLLPSGVLYSIHPSIQTAALLGLLSALYSIHPSLQTAALLGLLPSAALYFPSDVRMPVDPPLLLGLGLLLFSALPTYLFLFVYIVQLGTDVLGFNIGSNIGSCLYLTLTIAYHKYLLFFDWHFCVGMLTYWFYKPHINYLSGVYFGDYLQITYSQMITLPFLVRTARLVNLAVMTNLAPMSLNFFICFPLVMEWSVVPNYVFGIGPLHTTKCGNPIWVITDPYIAPYIQPFLCMFLPVLMAFHLRTINVILQGYDNSVNESLILIDKYKLRDANY